MNLIFAGTPAFAVPTLAALVQAGHTIRAVYTQPDRPAGRGRKLTASPVKLFAQEAGLVIRQPASLADEAAPLRALAPEAMIVVAYGLLLPSTLLDLPRYGCINVHASLLPRWRGAAPIARAVEAGDTVTGITIMQMEAGLDTGPMLATAQTPIHANDSAHTLHDRLALLGAQTLLATLERVLHGDLHPQTQVETAACYAKKLRKHESPVDWSLPAIVLHRKIRALNPWPVASTAWHGKVILLREVGKLEPHGAAGTPGTVLHAEASGIRVITGDGVVNITQLQAQGGKVLAAADFLNGHLILPGDRLGDNSPIPAVR